MKLVKRRKNDNEENASRNKEYQDQEEESIKNKEHVKVKGALRDQRLLGGSLGNDDQCFLTFRSALYSFGVCLGTSYL